MQTSLIQGASRGIGLAMVRQLLKRGERVLATCRCPERADALETLAATHAHLHIGPLDLEEPASIEAAAGWAGAHTDRIHRVVNVSGLLHDGEMGPEKKLEDIQPEHVARAFAVNATGPLLVARHFRRLFTHDARAVFASLSARVGSIGDNRLGGWYAYRASKAAQNQFTKTLSIELSRRSRNVIVLALHPGTVDTGLSKPFQRNVPEGKLFSPERAAAQLVAIIDGARPEDSGSFFDWAGKPIEW